MSASTTDGSNVPKIKDLGYANGWGQNTPTERQEHDRLADLERKEVPDAFAAERRHKLTVTKIGRSAERYTCHACGITWAVDSGD